MGMWKWFFKDATKIQNGRQTSTPIFFVGAKTQLKVRNYSNFTTVSHFPRYGDVQVIFLRKFKMAAMDKLHIFLWEQKLKN